MKQVFIILLSVFLTQSIFALDTSFFSVQYGQSSSNKYETESIAANIAYIVPSAGFGVGINAVNISSSDNFLLTGYFSGGDGVEIQLFKTLGNNQMVYAGIGQYKLGYQDTKDIEYYDDDCKRCFVKRLKETSTFNETSFSVGYKVAFNGLIIGIDYSEINLFSLNAGIRF